MVDKCAWCEATFLEGDTVVQEGSSRKHFCNRNCYHDYVKENLHSYLDSIEEVNDVDMTVL